eukprot:1368584-Rhodomonas_salina.2
MAHTSMAVSRHVWQAMVLGSGLCVLGVLNRAMLRKMFAAPNFKTQTSDCKVSPHCAAQRFRQMCCTLEISTSIDALPFRFFAAAPQRRVKRN